MATGPLNKLSSVSRSDTQAHQLSKRSCRLPRDLVGVRLTLSELECYLSVEVVPFELYSQEAKHSTLPRALGVFWVGQCRWFCGYVCQPWEKGRQTVEPFNNIWRVNE